APKKLTIEESRATFFEAKRLMNIFTLHNFSRVIDDAYALAVKLDIAVYDAAFVFLADRLGVRLLTLDKELVKKVEGTKFSNLLEYPNK
ncbi:MAG TPA: type II toxin-antitoxin system VapC family toxin, partial [Candidatus Deferrimicrobiaceae bacterium]|nr:type II toxin-antitoxin system VapC family toxin [Candidatus Deferrimicrobiaceae bacterium]